MTRLEIIASRIRARGYTLYACVSAPFANGNRSTVWGEALTPADYEALQKLLSVEKPAQPATDAQRARVLRAVDDAHERGERRRRR